MPIVAAINGGRDRRRAGPRAGVRHPDRLATARSSARPTSTSASRRATAAPGSSRASSAPGWRPSWRSPATWSTRAGAGDRARQPRRRARAAAAEAIALAARIAARPRLALEATKQALRTSWHTDLAGLDGVGLLGGRDDAPHRRVARRRRGRARGAAAALQRAMIGDTVVVDAVVHPYDLAPDNQNPQARAQLDAVYAAHGLAADPQRPAFALSEAEFFTDFPATRRWPCASSWSAGRLRDIHALPNLGFAVRLRDRPAPRGGVPRPASAARRRLRDRRHADLEPRSPSSSTRSPSCASTGSSSTRRSSTTAGARAGGSTATTSPRRCSRPPTTSASATSRCTRRCGCRRRRGRRSASTTSNAIEPLPRHDVPDRPRRRRVPRRDARAAARAPQPVRDARDDVRVRGRASGRLRQACSGSCCGPGRTACCSPAATTSCTRGRCSRPSRATSCPMPTLDELGAPQLTEQDRRNILGENTLRLFGMERDALLSATARRRVRRARGRGLRAPWSVAAMTRADVSGAPRGARTVQHPDEGAAGHLRDGAGRDIGIDGGHVGVVLVLTDPSCVHFLR